MLKLKKYGVCHVVHFTVLIIDWYWYHENFAHRNIKISHHSVNPSTAYKQNRRGEGMIKREIERKREGDWSEADMNDKNSIYLEIIRSGKAHET
jgi:hypothetical protein